MDLRQILLIILFGIHWVAFVVLLWKRRAAYLLLPIAVFTLLVITQFLWQSELSVPLGPLGHPSLRGFLRTIAIVLAVPSIGLMVHRIVIRRREAD